MKTNKMPTVRVRVHIRPWRCSCGAVSAQWIEECPHCDKPKTEKAALRAAIKAAEEKKP